LNAERRKKNVASCEHRTSSGRRTALREAYCVVLDDEGWHRGDWHYGVAGGGTPRAANAGHLATDEAHARDGRSHHFICCMPSNRARTVFALRRPRHAVGFALPSPISKSCASIWMATRAPAHSADFEPQLEFDRSCRLRSHARPLPGALLLEPLAWRIANQFSPSRVRLMRLPQP